MNQWWFSHPIVRLNVRFVWEKERDDFRASIARSEVQGCLVFLQRNEWGELWVDAYLVARSNLNKRMTHAHVFTESMNKKVYKIDLFSHKHNHKSQLIFINLYLIHLFCVCFVFEKQRCNLRVSIASSVVQCRRLILLRVLILKSKERKNEINHIQSSCCGRTLFVYEQYLVLGIHISSVREEKRDCIFVSVKSSDV